MSGERYHISDQHAVYFLTFTVVDWIDLFTRPEYKYIVTDALNYCIKEKNLECFAWVLMTNHLHLVVRANPPFKLSDVVRDVKKFTSKKLIESIQTIPESRKEWLLHKFAYNAKSTGRAEQFKVWQDGSHAVYLEGHDGVRLKQRINYTHLNPVKQMIVSRAEDYTFSSAGDYAGAKGLVNVSIMY